MVRFFVATTAMAGDRAVVTGQELEHLRRVLRLGPSDRITVFDDSGREHDAVIRSVDSEGAAIEIIRSYDPQRESPLDLTLAVGVTKGEKMDLVVEKATELGVRAIAPFLSRYAVPKLDQRKIAARTARWQKIAVSAAKQCGRTKVPELLPLRDFSECVAVARSDALKLCFWEKETTQSLRHLQDKRDTKSVLIAVGPEGGLTAEEAVQAEQHGFYLVSLGRRILRAETAAIAAVSLAQFLWGDLQ